MREGWQVHSGRWRPLAVELLLRWEGLSGLGAVDVQALVEPREALPMPYGGLPALEVVDMRAWAGFQEALPMPYEELPGLGAVDTQALAELQ